ncbi:MAG: anthranilate synthase component II [Thermoleophilia bacterium]
MLLMIDNYDSFTYNLVQYFWDLGEEVEVRSNDGVTVRDVEGLQPERIVISPGPGGPRDAGVSVDLIRRFAGRVPILGVCLGHQSVAYAFGADIVRAGTARHGKTSPVCHDGSGLSRGLPDPFEATRYHSLVVDRPTLPSRFRVSAWAGDDGEVMAINDDDAGLFGIQYHPESFLTGPGHEILANFLEVTV